MKLTILALIFSFATFASSNLSAKNANITSKDESRTSFFSASNTENQVFTGSTTTPFPPFAPLTFTKHFHHRGEAIKLLDAGTEFRLREGTYRVSFSGTFNVTELPTTHSASAIFEVALQLGSDIIFVNTQAKDFPLDTTGLVSFTKIIKVEKHTNLSVVVKNITPGSSTITAMTRTVAIKKLK